MPIAGNWRAFCIWVEWIFKADLFLSCLRKLHQIIQIQGLINCKLWKLGNHKLRQKLVKKLALLNSNLFADLWELFVKYYEIKALLVPPKTLTFGRPQSISHKSLLKQKVCGNLIFILHFLVIVNSIFKCIFVAAGIWKMYKNYACVCSSFTVSFNNYNCLMGAFKISSKDFWKFNWKWSNLKSWFKLNEIWIVSILNFRKHISSSFI